jgi:hypothetical protein
VYLETKTGVDDVLVRTDCGSVFVQAKNTVALSTRGELPSVAHQFVRQFAAGALEHGTRRKLDPARDRLVLAVGPEAAASVANDLRTALDRHRTHADTNQPVKYQRALEVFSRLIEAAWFSLNNAPITRAEKQAVLDLCAVVALNDTHRHLVEEALTHVVATPGDEEALVDLLIKWASDAAEKGTGGDAAAIRLELNGKIRFLAPPSFDQDVRRLAAYSQQTLNHLERYSTIAVEEGPMRLDRPFEAAVIEEAARGTLAVTGEPGAGKSAVLWSVAGKLRSTHPVCCVAVAGGANNLDALRREIGLEHSLLDVLQQFPGTRPAYLVLDALDASRGGNSEGTYRALLEAVAQLPDWRVIASVRTFDLKLGKAWQQLFPGPAPLAKFAEKDLKMGLR